MSSTAILTPRTCKANRAGIAERARSAIADISSLSGGGPKLERGE
jgi:hypothetical protein